MSEHLKLRVHIRNILNEDNLEDFVNYFRSKRYNVYGSEGMNPLHLAAKYSIGTSIASHCIDKLGIKIHLPTKRSKSTALHLAASSGNVSLLELLIQICPSLVDTPRKDKATPFLQAVKHGRKEAAALLLASGANINIVDKDNWNSAHWACLKGFAQVFRFLVDNGINYQVETPHHENCFVLAARANSFEIVTEIVNKFALPICTLRGGFFFYVRGNWKMLDWILTHTEWANLNKLELMLQIEAPTEIIQKHCEREITVPIAIHFDRDDWLENCIKRGYDLQEFLSHNQCQLGTRCKRVARWMQVAGVVFVYSKLRKVQLIGLLPLDLFRELLEYLINI